MMPLLAVLLAMTGCQTDEFPEQTTQPFVQQPDSQQISNASTPAESVQSEPIILREGDVLNITFPSSQSLDTTQQIRIDGKIVMPLIGEVVAAGKTPRTFKTS